MYRFGMVAALVVAGLAVGCGRGKSMGVEDVGQKETPAPAAKSAVFPRNRVTVWAAVVEGGAVVNGDNFHITLSRSVAGRPLDFRWDEATGRTRGMAAIVVTDVKNVTGYYVARVFSRRSEDTDYTVPVGEWRSIPLNPSAEGVTALFLEMGGKARVGHPSEMFRMPRKFEIEVSSPRRGEEFNQYDTMLVQWTSRGFNAPALCRVDLYSLDQGVWIRNLATDFLLSSGQFLWSIPDEGAPTGSFFVRVATYTPPIAEGWGGPFKLARAEPEL